MIRVRRWSLPTAVTLSALAILAVQSLPAQAASGKTASSLAVHTSASTACVYSVVDSRYIVNNNGTRIGSIQLLYNPCTRDVYAHGTTYLTCHSDGTGCVYAGILDYDLTYDATCTSGRNGQPQESCSTGLVNDANTQHAATADIDRWGASTGFF
jgi:hypothetical protein